MSMFESGAKPEKMAANLTVMSFMNSTSKYVKEGPVPVGEYEQARNLPAPQRYGSNRRLIKRDKKDNDGSSFSSQQQGVGDSVSEASNSRASDQAEIKNTLTYKNSTVSQVVVVERHQTIERKESSTPQSQRTTGLGYQKIEKSAQTPKNQSSAQQPKPSMFDIFDTTPKAQAGRYGANRRVQPQKTDQTSQHEDEKIKLATEIEPPQSTTGYRSEVRRIDRTSSQIVTQKPRPGFQTANRRTQTLKVQQAEIEPVKGPQGLQTPVQSKQVKPFSRNNTNSRVQRTITPINQKQQTEKQLQVQSETVAKVENKPLARSNARTQLKGKIEATTPTHAGQGQKNGQDSPLKAKVYPKFMLLVLRSISHRKMNQYFQLLRDQAIKQKKKQQSHSKLLAIKLGSLERLVNQQLYRIGFTKLSKFLNNQQIAKPSSKKLENMSKNSQKMLILLLNKLFANQYSTAMKRISYNKMKNGKPETLTGVLNRLYHNRIGEVFSRLRACATTRFSHRNKLLSNLSSIAKLYRLKVYELAFRRLSTVRKLQQKALSPNLKKNQKGSPIHDFDKDLSSLQSPDSSPEKLQKQKKAIEKLELSLKEKTARLNKLEEQSRLEKLEMQRKMDELKGWCEELAQQNEEKKRMNDQLKEKAMSIQFLEQDYIQTQDLLLDTKFPILYEAYIKTQKHPNPTLKISTLAQLLPEWPQQAEKNPQLQEWTELNKNLQLKRQISRFQGESQVLRKAAKIANEESRLLGQLIGGYVRERYTWEWVRTALSNISHG